MLAVLNSPFSWWFAWRTVYHGKDEALRLKSIFMQDYAIPAPTEEQSAEAATATGRLVELTRQRQDTTKALLDWLKVEHEITEPSTKIKDSLNADSHSFIAEVRKLRGKKNPLSLSALKNLREEHGRTILPAQSLGREVQSLEVRINDLVNSAFGLTTEEIRLMWETAPPRMPIASIGLAARLPAIRSLPAHPAFPRRLPHVDFFADDPPPLANLLGYREDLGAKSLGVLDLDPRTVAQDDDAERRPVPVLLFDEEEVGPELEPVPSPGPQAPRR